MDLRNPRAHDLARKAGPALILRRILLLEDLRVGADLALLAVRLLVGAFLVWGVWDNIVSGERMREFAAFLAHHEFAAPQIMAPLSVYAQFACGLAFIVGFAIRWAGLVCAFNFVVALIMVDAENGPRAAFPAAALVAFGLLMATLGPGRLALESLVFKRS